MITHDFEQGSDEWKQFRAGKITASRVKALMAKTKSGYSTSRANMITQLAIERVTGTVDEGYSNAAMLRGIEMEPEARNAYAMEHLTSVQEIGSVTHPDWDFVTCSPDGLVSEDGLVEIKCPSAMAKHYAALQTGDHAKEYKWQLHHQMLVTGRDWVDAVSYDPRFPDGLKLAIVRIEKDAEIQEELRAAIVECNVLIEQQVQSMREIQKVRKAA